MSQEDSKPKSDVSATSQAKLADDTATDDLPAVGPTPEQMQRRRNSLKNWLHAVDVVELVNWIGKKYGTKQIPTDQVDGAAINDPETIFSKILSHSLVGTGIAKAAAFMTTEGQLFAQKNLMLTGEQIRAIVANLSDPSKFSAKGITLGPDHFLYLSSQGGVVRARAKDGRLCTVARTKHLLIVVVYVKEKQPIAEELIADLQAQFKAQGV